MRADMWAVGPVLQAFDALGGIPGQPVVNRLPRHPIPGGDLRLRSPTQALHHGVKPLLHDAQLRESHPVLLPPGYRRKEGRADPVSNINRGRSVNHQPAQDSRPPAMSGLRTSVTEQSRDVGDTLWLARW